MSAFTKKYQLTLFFVLTLLLTWALWIPALIVKRNGGDSILAPDSGVGSLGRWMPGVAALLLVGLSDGRSAAGQLFHSLRTWRLGYFWYAFALLLPAGLFYLGRGIDALLGNSYQVTAPVTELPAAMIPFVIIFALPGVLAEELGWRGFAQPRLQQKQSALLASLLIGFFWGIWHLPSLIYFDVLRDSPALSGAIAVLDTMMTAVLYGWLYNNTRGSLLLVCLFHLSQQMTNNFLGVLPTHTDTFLTLAAALLIITFTGGADFSRRRRRVQAAV